MTESELESFAAALIHAQLEDVDYLGIYEAYEEYGNGEEISEDDARAVYDLMLSAEVTVTWDD